MRKLLIIAFLFAIVAVQAQVTAYDSYISFPAGKAERVVLADTGINVILAHNTCIYAIQSNLETAADTVKANMTINVTIDAGLKVGSLLYVEVQTGTKASPFTITFATGCVGLAPTLTANKKQVISLLYNGTAYRVINKYNIN
jgi:hypothetical protein